MLKNYNVLDDYYVEMYFEDKDLSPETEKNYVKQLNKFCNAVGKKLKDIIEECKAQQDIETEEIISDDKHEGKQVIKKRVMKFDVDGADSLIRQHFKQFEKYCKSRGNKNTTINSGLDTIRSVLSHFGVELPNFPNLKDDRDNWELLSKEDFKFVLADSSLMHKSLILFMLSSGLRIFDCLNLTIGDYMEATSDYHDFIEVDDFIDNAPDDMRGYWDFEPHKTEKKHTVCKTFNSAESNKFILQNLRRVKNEYMPRKSKKIHKELKLTKSDALFGSKRGFYKQSPEVLSISTMYGHKNKKLYDWHLNKINQDIKDGKISVEDYDKYVDLIPKFHPHACRKYFMTMIERHTSNERRYRLMEGHAPKNSIDKSYINISKKEIAEVYDEAEIDLSVYREDNEDLDKLRDDFNQQLDTQEKKHQDEIAFLKEKHQYEIDSLKVRLKETDKAVKDLGDKIDESRINIPFHKVRDVLLSYLEDIGEMDNNRFSLLNLMVLDYVKNNPAEFDDSEDYLLDLVRKLDIKIELSNKDIIEQHVELATNMNGEDIDPVFVIFVDDLYEIIRNNDGVMKRIGNIDSNKFDYVAEEYLLSSGIINDISNVDISDISDEDKIKIASDVLLKYLECN